MSLMIFDGFDLYSSTTFASKAGWSNGGCIALTSSGRFGGGCIRTDVISGWINNAYLGAKPGMICQFAFKATGLLSQDFIIAMDSAAIMVARLSSQSGGGFQAKNASNTVVATSAPGIYRAGVWHYVELKVIAGDAGNFVFNLDGFNIFNLSNFDASAGNNNISYFRIYLGTVANYWFMDDIVIMSTDGATFNDCIGDCRINTLKPTNDTAQDDWLKNTGSDAYAVIDDNWPGNDDSDSTYLYSNVVGDKTLVGCAPLGRTPSVIHALNTVFSGRKTTVDARTARAYINSNSAEAVGASRGPGTSYLMYRDIHEKNPDGDVAWSESTVNAVNLGVELLS